MVQKFQESEQTGSPASSPLSTPKDLQFQNWFHSGFRLRLGPGLEKDVLNMTAPSVHFLREIQSVSLYFFMIIAFANYYIVSAYSEVMI